MVKGRLLRYDEMTISESDGLDATPHDHVFQAASGSTLTTFQQKKRNTRSTRIMLGMLPTILGENNKTQKTFSYRTTSVLGCFEGCIVISTESMTTSLFM